MAQSFIEINSKKIEDLQNCNTCTTIGEITTQELTNIVESKL